jgi:hypothetical protein
MRSLVAKCHHSSRHVLDMMKNKISLRDMKALRSQSHQKNKMKKNLKSMSIFSKAPSTMKETIGKEMVTNINLSLLTRSIILSSKELFHQKGLSQTGTKISFLAIVFIAIILVIR